jgi:hypothetical protein
VKQREGLETTELKQAWPGNNNDFGPFKRRAIREGKLHVHKKPGGTARLHYSGKAGEGCHPGEVVD